MLEAQESINNNLQFIFSINTQFSVSHDFLFLDKPKHVTSERKCGND